jgi:2-methylcitrate dehydratase PrpD
MSHTEKNQRRKSGPARSGISPLMRTVSNYIARAARKPLPAAVSEITRHHLLDTLAAIISGSRLLPGRVTIAYLKTQGGTREACVPGTRIVTTAANAAFGSGMLAHADETDDSHALSLTHPGCGIVPAALAMAERTGASGTALLRATALGYDICARSAMSLGPYEFFASGHDPHTFGTLFGATASAASLAGLSALQVRHLLSYAAHSASGRTYQQRDTDHIEKSFAHGAKSARDAVAATNMIESGFTGIDDAFSGEKNFYFSFSRFARPPLLVRGLGTTYEVVNTNIKRWTTGSPTQAMLDSLSELLRTHRLTEADIAKTAIRISHHGYRVVNNRPLPTICMQHLAALMLVDGTVTFASSHDQKRMKDPRILEVRRRIDFSGDDALERALPSKQCIVELTLRDGRKLRHHTKAVRGTAKNRMNRREVDDKCYSLIAPVLGAKRARSLVDAIWNVDQLDNVRKLRPLLKL